MRSFYLLEWPSRDAHRQFGTCESKLLAVGPNFSLQLARRVLVQRQVCSARIATIHGEFELTLVIARLVCIYQVSIPHLRGVINQAAHIWPGNPFRTTGYSEYDEKPAR